MAGHERPRAFDTAEVCVGIERAEAPPNAARDRKLPTNTGYAWFLSRGRYGEGPVRRQGIPRGWNICAKLRAVVQQRAQHLALVRLARLNPGWGGKSIIRLGSSDKTE